ETSAGGRSHTKTVVHSFGQPLVKHFRWHTAAAVAVASLAAVVLPARGADWPQWRGPERNGISAETGWLSHWPGSGPKRLWSAKVGEGFSNVAVANGRLYTAGNAANRDTVYCLNATTGKP